MNEFLQWILIIWAVLLGHVATYAIKRNNALIRDEIDQGFKLLGLESVEINEVEK